MEKQQTDMLLYIHLGGLETVNKLCMLCEEHKDEFYVDVIHGRQTIDACSVIGVTSLIGKIVKIKPITNDSKKYENFYHEFVKIGGFSA